MGILNNRNYGTMSRRKGRITWPKVLCKNPDLKSQAALHKLNRKYRMLVMSQLGRPEWRIWLSFRNRLLKRISRVGPLTCYYCGRTPLYQNTKITPDESQATIDHIYPRSRGGKEYDEKNLVVACMPCNSKKGDKILV